jgi:sortase A
VPWDASGIDPQTEGYWLVLSTCWPLDSMRPGSLRYLVKAVLVGREYSAR